MLLTKAPYLAAPEWSPLLCCINSSGGYNGEHVGGHRGGTQMVEPPALRYKEKNQLGPATNRFYPSLFLHFSACHFSLGFLFYWEGFNIATMLRVFSTTIPSNHSAVLFPQAPSASQLALLNIGFCNIILAHQTQREVNKPWSSSSSPLNVSYQPRCYELHCMARPLSVSLAQARQRGWAAKHSAQWHMLCGFLGTGWRTVVLLCQASL